MKNKKGYIYLISTTDIDDNDNEGKLYYKIGITKNNPKLRVKQLSTGSAAKLILLREYESVEYKKIERMLHRDFGGKRKEGEWFDLTDEDIFGFIDKCKEADDIIGFLKENNPFYK